MEYVAWNSKKINEQLSFLKRLYRETKDEDLSYDIDLLLAAKARKVKPFSFPGNFHDQFLEEFYAVKSNIPFLEEIEIFSKLDNLLRRDLIGYEDEYDISPKDLLDFTHDFYKDIDPVFSKIFLKVFEERKNNLRFTRNRGIIFTIDRLDYSYLSIAKEDVVADYINTIHEYAHAIADRLFYRNNYNSGYPFIELMPLLMEFLACDKMMESFTNVNRDVTGYKADELNNMIQYAIYINWMAKYLHQINYNERNIPKKKKAIVNDMMMRLHTGKEEVLDILDISTLERLSYLIPYMTAIELYYLYKKDPEKAIYILKEIITLPASNNYNIFLMDREIYLNEHSKKYTLEINRDLKRFRD